MAAPRFLYPIQSLAKVARQKAAKLTIQSISRKLGYGALAVMNFACFSHLFVEYVGSLSLMAGPSMLPTLANDGELVVIDRLSTRLNPHNIQRGELLILLSPLDPQRMICKRVAGLPGDIVCVDPTGQGAPSTEHVKIPKGHIWIMGDNAEASRDSRTYGPVPIGLIQGKLRARLWPFSSATIFRPNLTYID